MNDTADGPTRPTSRRPRGPYRINDQDGTWWLIGWDGLLDTYFALRLVLERSGEDVLDVYGTDLGEIRTIGELTKLIGRSVPRHVADALADDAATWPFTGTPPHEDYVPLAERDHPNHSESSDNNGTTTNGRRPHGRDLL